MKENTSYGYYKQKFLSQLLVIKTIELNKITDQIKIIEEQQGFKNRSCVDAIFILKHK